MTGVLWLLIGIALGAVVMFLLTEADMRRLRRLHAAKLADFQESAATWDARLAKLSAQADALSREREARLHELEREIAAHIAKWDAYMARYPRVFVPVDAPPPTEP